MPPPLVRLRVTLAISSVLQPFCPASSTACAERSENKSFRVLSDLSWSAVKPVDVQTRPRVGRGLRTSSIAAVSDTKCEDASAAALLPDDCSTGYCAADDSPRVNVYAG
jgi:hypothetical protein